LRYPVPIPNKEFHPIAVLSFPLLRNKAAAPREVLREPVTLNWEAAAPTAVLFSPVVAENKEPYPIAVLLAELAIAELRAVSPKTVFADPVIGPCPTLVLLK
jgi:hypothetical protein